jgi:hypothetical protein
MLKQIFREEQSDYGDWQDPDNENTFRMFLRWLLRWSAAERLRGPLHHLVG